MSRSIVQEYLTELTSIILPKLQQYQQSRTRDSSMIRFGTLIDGEVRALQNSRWAIPIYNMPRIDAATIDAILKVFPRGTEPDIVCFDLHGTMNVEIQFQPVGRQQSAVHPQQYGHSYDPGQQSNGGGIAGLSKLVLTMFILSILVGGAYMLYFESLAVGALVPEDPHLKFVPETWNTNAGDCPTTLETFSNLPPAAAHGSENDKSRKSMPSSMGGEEEEILKKGPTTAK